MSSLKAELQTNSDLKFTDATTVKRVYAIARVVDETFKEAGIHYWATAGTLLGCVRHQGLIPWDDDLDVCMYEEDKAKLDKLERLLNDRGYQLMECAVVGYTIFHESESEKVSEHAVSYHRYPFCDVWVMAQDGDRRSSDSRSDKKRMVSDRSFPEEYYNHQDTVQTERRAFGDLFLNCPANSEEYLTRNYGKNYLTEGMTPHWDHINKCDLKPVRFKLEKEHYQPARPFK